MVDIKLAKPKRPKRLPEPPTKPRRVGNLHKPDGGSNVPLQLKISPELRREYRAFAADHDLELNKLFRIIWEHYRRNGPQ
ncbi:hypothetical protein K1W69_00020 [Hoeflea sp. WL0058]|uniref:Uncharacterized protein n=1 Tax=Flavimaribacter sediminis TaxID=2865987 RepID=A0AAE2ZFG7_9HYPH|nr:hypothetical protein [Flavimaribacter sediminis]MBW8635554.1 hypothetical protein [Flavimaribacter sediminis]